MSYLAGRLRVERHKTGHDYSLLSRAADRIEQLEAQLAQAGDPVAWTIQSKSGYITALYDNKEDADDDPVFNPDGGDRIVPLFTAPPAPAVPEGFCLVRIDDLRDALARNKGPDRGNEAIKSCYAAIDAAMKEDV